MTSDAETRSRIVVGVDGSAVSVQALRWALGQAETTGATVELVTAWDVPASYGVGPTVLEGEDLAGNADKAVAAVVDGVLADHPSVATHRLLLRGHPAAVLLARAENADLLVVGSHGHGGFVGMLLGSVSQQCVHHATCPVVVVRSERDAAQPR